MQNENVSFNYVVDTMRKKQILPVINWPILKTTDTHILHMANLLLETLSINKTKGYCTVRPLILQTNPIMSKTFFHKLVDKDGCDVSRSYLLKPRKELCDEYEARKDQFIDKLYTREEEKQKKKEGVVEKLKANESFTPQELKVYDLKYRQHKKASEIGRIIGVGDVRVSQILKSLRLKAQFGIENNKEMTKPIGKSNSPINLIINLEEEKNESTKTAEETEKEVNNNGN